MRYTQQALDKLTQDLYVAVVADILDELGEKDFCLSGDLRPMKNSGKFLGYARTLYAVDVFAVPEKPYQKDLEFLDSLEPGDVVVTTVNGNNHNGYIGELLSTACMARGARGCVLDGHARDLAFIDLEAFPIYCRGTNPLDSKGRVDAVSADEPMVCGGVLVRPGDLIFADEDGIVRIPAKLIDKVIPMAAQKVQGENTVREELMKGASVKATFDKYGIL
ncbi:MAG: RraA family protein [Oscillospiraceae bacterium]|jgi:4-hydroxy-4-methyl-2-oxoglutarate aldolase|nr:RraA family protein [Oscillospiraceae bacterium]